jgi:hypothetical protein
MKLIKQSHATSSVSIYYFLSRSFNQRTQRTRARARGNLGSFHAALLAANLLLDWLVKPSPDTKIPLLVEVLIGDDCTNACKTSNTKEVISIY